MQRFRDNILIMGPNGLIPYSGSTVAVYLAGTSTLASIYPSNDPASAKENPFRAGDYGEIDFYAKNGRYDLLLSRQGYQSLRITDLQIWDPANSDFVTDVDVDVKIAGKADKTYVDEELAEKADADATALALAEKVNIADLANDTDPDKGAAGVGYSGRTIAERIAEYLSIKDKGAKGDGVTNDAAAEISAHTERNTVFYPTAIGQYLGADNPRNLYNNNYRNALFGRVQAGLSTNPEVDASPVMWVQKVSGANRSVNPAEWDQGGLYSGLVKISGDAYGAALTGYARHEGGSGDLIGIHGRGYAMHEDAEVWGGWSYAFDTTAGSYSIIGHEVNIKKAGPDIGWQDVTAPGNSRGLVIVTGDNSGPATHAVYIGAQGAAGGTDGWYTGMLTRQDSIRPNADPVELGDGEVIRMQGGSTNSRRYGGIRLQKGVFQYGVSFTESSFQSNCAILMGVNQRIVFGTRPTNGNYLAFTSDSMLNLNAGGGFGISGAKVLGPRRTGWATPSGLTDKAGFATYTAPTVSATYEPAEMQALAQALQDVSRHTAALINDLINHGLIGD